jgi:CoA:oxalate CoA-transferase
MIATLDGVVVLDLTSNVAGPYATSILRDLGARVWKVEGLNGDTVRGWPPFWGEGVSTTFASLNRGKQSVGLDLKSAAGKAALKRLVEKADVVVESMRPGAFAALGFTAEEIHRINPRAVYCSLTAYGHAGPRSGEPGYDAIIQAYSGLMNLTGHPGQEPARVGTGMIDLGAGMWIAMGVLAALFERERTGRGSTVEGTLFGTAVGFMPHHLASVVLAGVVPQRIGTAQHNSAPYEAIQAADGLVMVGVANEGLWKKFKGAVDDGRLEAPELESNALRVQNRPRMRELINSLTSAISADELVDRLRSHGIPCSVIRDVGELPTDPQLRALELIQQFDDGAELTVLPLRIDGESVSTAASVPALGEHSRQILIEAGIDPDQVDALVGDRRPVSEPAS